MNNNKIITDLLNAKGVDLVGFSRVDRDLPFAITIVVPLSKYIVSQIGSQPTFEYFHHYRTVNTFIDQTLLQCGMEISRQGFDYLCVPASQSTNGLHSVFPHKTAARLSGMGWIGKNALFISAKYGPAVRLGTILTNMEFETGYPVSKDCGMCTICRDACPAMAIRGVNYEDGIARDAIIDAQACSDYMKNQFQHIGRGSVCGICISCCPYFRQVAIK